MKQYSVSSIKVLGLLLAVLVALPVSAAEILVEQDFKQHIIKGEQLVRVADNALFLIDSSGSMNKKFQDTGQSRYDVVVSEFKARTSYFPEIGHKFGVYLYTPWTEIYPMQTFNREKFAEALESLPPKGKRVTPLHRGLDKADELLGTLQGRTALFLVTDGTYTRDDSDVMKPIEKAREMVKKHDVCFYVISAAKEKRNQKMLKNIAGLNSCSRLIPFANFIKYPDYRTGALFAVKATETVVTTMDTKVVGLEANNLRFEFNKADVQSIEMRELDEVGAFLQAPLIRVGMQGLAP